MLSNISIASTLVAAGAAAAVVLAPAAYADGGSAPCADEGSATVCQAPGNANVIATPPEQSSSGAAGAAEIARTARTDRMAHNRQSVRRSRHFSPVAIRIGGRPDCRAGAGRVDTMTWPFLQQYSKLNSASPMSITVTTPTTR